MAKRQNTGIKQVAEELGVSTKWVRRQIAAGLISPGRTGTKRNSRFVLTESDIEALRVRRDAPPAIRDAEEGSSLARIDQLEALSAWDRVRGRHKDI